MDVAAAGVGVGEDVLVGVDAGVSVLVGVSVAVDVGDGVAALDGLLMGHWTRASNGDVTATRTVLSIMDRRAKLLGLDAPPRLDITGWIREMAIAEGLDPLEKSLAGMHLTNMDGHGPILL